MKAPPPAAPPEGERPSLNAYLAAVEAFVRRYVAFPSEHESVAVALWVAHAHLCERFETSPILAVTSAEMRSGKTRTLDVLELLCPRPFRVVTPSEAVVYTALDQRPRRTLLLDEADIVFNLRRGERFEGLRAILNAGNRRGTPVPRVRFDGKRRRKIEEFDVFGPKAIAGIGDLPGTISDRAIRIRLKRRAPTEPVARFRRRIAESEASAVALDASTVTLVPDVPLPDELNDRAADSWEPLMAIASAAAGPWPERARLAAVALSGEDEAPQSPGIRLLSDLREVFGREEHLPTRVLLHRLHQIEDAPWAGWYGAPLTSRELAVLLEPYRVRPTQRRIGGEKVRGYFRTDLTDAWDRYLPTEPGTGGTNEADRPPDGDGADTPAAVTMWRDALDRRRSPSARDATAATSHSERVGSTSPPGLMA